ncbi:hypothetical protein TorRG33x02_016960, partial [Trema orientale]
GIKYSTLIKADVEKFDGNINFGLWHVQVRDLLIQSGLHNILKGRDKFGKSKISDEDWKDLDERAASAIRMCLAKNILVNMLGISTAKDLWEKLRKLYRAKGVSNRVYLKKQFYTLHMSKGTTISDHLSILNSIVSGWRLLELRLMMKIKLYD